MYIVVATFGYDRPEAWSAGTMRQARAIARRLSSEANPGDMRWVQIHKYGHGLLEIVEELEQDLD